ncbi:MAG: hypothetical protein EXR72_08340 [Myxococcales bacterium]|nr:hypothetical protein [Myxococcales bacterium]
MKTRALLLFSLSLAVIGCGGKTPPADGGKADLASQQDLTMAPTEDMSMQLAATGEPCTKPAQCDGTKPVCITKDSQGATWPEGYCSATCSSKKNDADGINPNCPGGGHCTQQGNCVTICDRNNLCQRTGYSCFVAGLGFYSCAPSSRSQCDPNKNNCPQDGGVFTSVDGGPDGGTYSGRACVSVGVDVGECRDGCDPFLQNCVMNGGCYATFIQGYGICSSPGTAKEGEACMYLNGCLPGLSCRTTAMMGSVCRHYCRTGAKLVACPMGQKCNDLSMTVKADKVGVCTP